MRTNSLYKSGNKIGGRYQVHQVLAGGMGVVYLCYDPQQLGPVAIKTFQEEFMSNQAIRERFIREARTWIDIDKHPNVVRAYWVEIIEDRPYLLLEMVADDQGFSSDLRRWMLNRQKYQLDLKRSLRVALGICLGLRHAGNKIPGLVHRDLKPENVLITKFGQAKVTDFGLVNAVHGNEVQLEEEPHTSYKPTLTQVGTVLGTLPYMSPEQCLFALGQSERAIPLDRRSDIYAFGCLLYELLTNQQPFNVRATNRREWLEEWLHCHLEIEPVAPTKLNPLLPEPLDEIAMRCLHKQPDMRYQTWDDLIDAFSLLYEQLSGERLVLEAEDVNPTYVDLLHKGASLFNLGHQKEALHYFDQALRDDSVAKQPNYEAILWSNKAIILNQMGNQEQALEYTTKAINLASEEPSLWNQRGLILKSMRRFQEALQCFDEAIRIQAAYNSGWARMWTIRLEDPAPWINKGHTLICLNRYEEAILCFDQVIKSESDSAGPWVGKGLALALKGSYDEALACIDQALRINPVDSDAWLWKCRLLHESDNFEEALASTARALQVDPENEEVWCIRGAVLSDIGKNEDALTCLEKALEINPESALTLGNKGNVLFRLGLFAEAQECYSQALRIHPNNPMGWNNRGFSLYSLGDIQQAIACYDEALRLDPRLILAWRNKAKALEEEMRHQEAIECHDRVLEIDPKHIPSLIDKGAVLFELGEFKPALDCAEQVLQIDPEDAMGWANKSTALFALGQLAEASTSIDEAIRIAPGRGDMWYLKGAMLANSGHLNEALFYLERAQKLGHRLASQVIAQCRKVIGQ